MFGRRIGELTAKAWNTDARPLGMSMENLIERAEAAARAIEECASRLSSIDLAALERVAMMFFPQEANEVAGQVIGAAQQLRNAARRARELEDAGRPITD